jgi:glycosyltransferase involved in cell wall biosynthesis
MLKKKRLLLVTFFFPPYNPTESRRALIIAKAAVKANWNVDVITTSAKNFHSTGKDTFSLKQFEAFSGLHILRTKAGLWDTFPLLSRVLKWLLRRTLQQTSFKIFMDFPDRCVSWLLFAIPFSMRIAIKEKPDVILTSSFPYSAHLIGYVISKLFRIPWIADTRDGWAADDSEQFTIMEPNPKKRKMHKALMNLVVNEVSQYWSLTQGINRMVADLFPEQPSDKFVYIVQGYDNKINFDTQSIAVFDKLIIGYAGRFRPNFTPAEPIAEAFAYIKSNYPETYYSRLWLYVWGGKTANVRGSYEYLTSTFDRYNVADHLCHMDYLPENDLIASLNKCDVLLLSNGSSPWTRKRLTTKLFVYLSAKKPILAICEKSSAIDEFIKSTKTGESKASMETRQIAETLVGWIDKKSCNASLSFQPDLVELESYSLPKGVMPKMISHLNREII